MDCYAFLLFSGITRKDMPFSSVNIININIIDIIDIIIYMDLNNFYCWRSYLIAFKLLFDMRCTRLKFLKFSLNRFLFFYNFFFDFLKLQISKELR